MDKTIWIYWENKYSDEMPGYISLCRDTIYKHKGAWDLIELNPENVDQYVSGLRADFHDIPEVAHKADYIRAAVLAQNGGMWMDVDTIVLRPLSMITDLIEESGALFYGWKEHQPSIGLVASLPGNPLITEWLKAADEVLDKNLGQKWSGIGYDILWPLAKEYPYVQIDREICAPIHYTETDKLLGNGSASSILKTRTILLQLYNKMLYPKFGHASRGEVTSSNTRLSKLFERAFKDDQHWEKVAKKMSEDTRFAKRAFEESARTGVDPCSLYIDEAMSRVYKSKNPLAKRALNKVKKNLGRH